MEQLGGDCGSLVGAHILDRGGAVEGGGLTYMVTLGSRASTYQVGRDTAIQPIKASVLNMF